MKRINGRPLLVMWAAWCLPLVACSDGAPREEASPGSVAGDAAPYVDSLVLATGGGVEVWFTDGRPGRGPDGEECHERVMQIRGPSDTVAVPLLYTGETPTLADDSTLVARVWLDCRPGNSYRVDLRTGRPSLVER